MEFNYHFLVPSGLVKSLMRITLGVVMIVALFVSSNAYAGDTAKAKQNKTKDKVIFDNNIPSKQRAAILEIANTIRSGNKELIKKYTKKGGDTESIITFWSSVDKLSNLKFKARKWKEGITLSESEWGMSSCDLVYEENRLVIGECTFNDGN
jgi:hypothetical protein